MTVEIREIATGLWLWRTEHPDWQPGDDWQPMVTSTVAESDGEVVLIDPLAPPPDAADLWARIDSRPPTAVVIRKPDHIRDVDLFARRYEARAFGPDLFFRQDIPLDRAPADLAGL